MNPYRTLERALVTWLAWLAVGLVFLVVYSLVAGCTMADAKDDDCRTLRTVRLTHDRDGVPCAWTSSTTNAAIDPTCCPFGWEPVGIDADAVVCVEL